MGKSYPQHLTTVHLHTHLHRLTYCLTTVPRMYSKTFLHAHTLTCTHPVSCIRVSKRAHAFIYEFLLFYLFLLTSFVLLQFCDYDSRSKTKFACPSFLFFVLHRSGAPTSTSKCERMSDHMQLNSRKSSMPNPILIKIVCVVCVSTWHVIDRKETSWPAR